MVSHPYQWQVFYPMNYKHMLSTCHTHKLVAALFHRLQLQPVYQPGHSISSSHLKVFRTSYHQLLSLHVILAAILCNPCYTNSALCIQCPTNSVLCILSCKHCSLFPMGHVTPAAVLCNPYYMHLQLLSESPQPISSFPFPMLETNGSSIILNRKLLFFQIHSTLISCCYLQLLEAVIPLL